MGKNSDKNTSFSSKRIFSFNGKIIDLSAPRVMGIINLTPDSFYDSTSSPPVPLSDPRVRGDLLERGNRGKGGSGALRTANREPRTANWIKKVGQMLQEGAYIIDLGAVSTRPGAAEVETEEEIKRLMPVLKEIRKDFPGLIISVDTWRAEVARMAAGEGADMINDISGGTFDPEMIPLASGLGIPYIIMHIQGRPGNMQINPSYDNVTEEVFSFLIRQAARLEESGHDKIILDPGFGFGKTVEHNYRLLNHLDILTERGYPVLAGLSRKSMINKVLGTKPAEALNGTTVLNTIALLKGVSILRVHDVKEAVETIKLVNELI